MDSRVEPDELNLSNALAAMLVDRIDIHKNKEGTCSKSNAAEQLRKRKATAEENLRAQEKWITAGVLAAAGKFHLSSQVRDYVQQKVANAQQKEYNKKLKMKD